MTRSCCICLERNGKPFMCEPCGKSYDRYAAREDLPGVLAAMRWAAKRARRFERRCTLAVSVLMKEEDGRRVTMRALLRRAVREALNAARAEAGDYLRYVFDQPTMAGEVEQAVARIGPNSIVKLVLGAPASTQGTTTK